MASGEHYEDVEWYPPPGQQEYTSSTTGGPYPHVAPVNLGSVVPGTHAPLTAVGSAHHLSHQPASTTTPGLASWGPPGSGGAPGFGLHGLYQGFGGAIYGTQNYPYSYPGQPSTSAPPHLSSPGIVVSIIPLLKRRLSYYVTQRAIMCI